MNKIIFISTFIFLCFDISSVNCRTVQAGCRDARYNRFGNVVCLDNTPRSTGLYCPLMPRMNLDCNDRYYFKRNIIHKACRSDLDCPSNSKCCVDICPRAHLICTPGDFMSYYIPFK